MSLGRAPVYLSLEGLDSVETPVEGESLFQLWVQAEGRGNDCFEFSAPCDLLMFDRLTPARLAWIKATMATIMVSDNSLCGEWEHPDLQAALNEERLVMKVGGQDILWVDGPPLTSFRISDEIVRAARLDEELPAPVFRPSKPRF